MVSLRVMLVFCGALIICNANSNCPKIKTRSKWGGKTAISIEYQNIPVQYVIIHHTVTSKCGTFATCSQQVANIQHYHMHDLGWSDIGLNFLIGNDGNVYEGAGWNKVGAHTLGYNRKSIGIAFIGDFSDELPSEKALQAAKSLLACGVSNGYLARNYRLLGARQVISTESPGLELYGEIQDWDNWVPKP
ncbi:unnamed protein product [Hermetia illucens]|uniref:Peptidoglycan-recognition protein n=1 Tax=Hermetia illucens TaxID=343691 RepID=A0A7R8V0W6_HERIL|nr:peptidoglycan-recognition protein SA-like [Hermetia illucens]CAD7090194.1 unnamed protein product [Hermetia illucens]